VLKIKGKTPLSLTVRVAQKPTLGVGDARRDQRVPGEGGRVFERAVAQVKGPLQPLVEVDAPVLRRTGECLLGSVELPRTSMLMQ
jgi:hypothetical protein